MTARRARGPSRGRKKRGPRREREDAQAIVRALRQGDVDALVVADQVVTLGSADRPFRALAEIMGDGAATVALDGQVLWANRHLADALGAPLEEVVGGSILAFVPALGGGVLAKLAREAGRAAARLEALLRPVEGPTVPVALALVPVADMDAVALIVTKAPGVALDLEGAALDASTLETLAALCERASLTPREMQVVVLVSRGLTNRAVGECLDIGSVTVACYLTKIYRKLRVHGRSELMALVLTGHSGAKEVESAPSRKGTSRRRPTGNRGAP